MSRNQKVNRKFNAVSRLSGEVTALLSGMSQLPATEAYKRIQASETAALAAATSEMAAAARLEESTSTHGALRKQVRQFNAACMDICRVQGIVSAEHFAVIDKGDDAGMARRLEPVIRTVPRFGPGLADSLKYLVDDLEVAQSARAAARSKHDDAQRDLDTAIFNLQGIVAQGRAVLTSFRVKLSRKTKKKPTSNAANSNTESGQPSLVPAAA
jgi:hypothetical protein